MWIDYIPWVSGILFVLLFNKKLLQKPRTVNFIAITNGIFALIWIVLGFKYFIHASGFGAYAFAVLFLLITGGRALYLVIKGINESKMLLHTELSVMIAGFFFFTQIGSFQVPIEFNIANVFMIVLNIVSLIRIRIYGSTSKSIEASKWQGMVFFSALAALFGCLTTAVLLFLSVPFRTFFMKLIAFFKYLIISFFKGLEYFLSWLFSWFKTEGEMIMPEQEGFSVPEKSEMEFFDFNPDILIIIGIIAVVAVILLLWIIFRKSKFKVITRIHPVTRYHHKNGSRILYRLYIILKNLYNKIRFIITLLILRNTPGAAFIIIEKKGMKNGLPRLSHETPGAYLKRLNRYMKWENGHDEAYINSLLHIFIDMLENSFYGCPQDTCNSKTMGKSQVKQLLGFYLKGKVIKNPIA